MINIPVTGTYTYRDGANTPARGEELNFVSLTGPVVEDGSVTVPKFLSVRLDNTGSVPAGFTLPTVSGQGIYYQVKEKFQGGRGDYVIHVQETDTVVDLLTVAPVLTPPQFHSLGELQAIQYVQNLTNQAETSAELAGEASLEATAQADYAFDSALQAAQARDLAQISANNAQASANTATASANTASTAADTATASATTASNAASSAATSAATATTKAGEASTSATSAANSASAAAASAASAAALTDGNKGDITISAGGTVWSLNLKAVTLTKMADVASGTVFYRKSVGTGSPETQTLATLKADLGLSGTNTGDQTTISGNAGTATTLQTARTIAISGKAKGTATSFNGSANITIPITSVSLVAADIPALGWSKITTGKPTTLSGYGITDAINTSQKGANNGVASLDAGGKVPSVQLPSYMDDVLEYANLAAFPATGTAGIIYVALDTNKVYRWSGSAYTEISPSPGSTDAVPEGASNLYFTNARAQAAVTTISGNAATATKLATPRTIAISGKVTGTATSFDGSGNITINATGLSIAAGDVPTLNQNTTGSAGSVAWTGVSGKPTTISGYGITDAYTKTQIDSSLAGKASLNTTVYFVDVTASRGDGTGVIFFGNTATRYLYYNGTNYVMPGAALSVNGGTVWTSSTFDPSTKANVSGQAFTGTVTAPNLGATNSAGAYFSGNGSGTQHNGTMYHNGTVNRLAANGAAWIYEPRVFVQSGDPGALAADGDVWMW